MGQIGNFIEALQGQPLPTWQRDMIANLERAKAEGREVVICKARQNGMHAMRAAYAELAKISEEG